MNVWRSQLDRASIMFIQLLEPLDLQGTKSLWPYARLKFTPAEIPLPFLCPLGKSLLGQILRASKGNYYPVSRGKYVPNYSYCRWLMLGTDFVSRRIDWASDRSLGERDRGLLTFQSILRVPLKDFNLSIFFLFQAFILWSVCVFRFFLQLA